MRVLLLAPHPFLQERGTPIDVDLVLRVLSQRADTEIDMVTYAEGEDVEYPGLQIYRIDAKKGLAGLRPGFSVKKLLCDVLLFKKAWRLVAAKDYDLIHAGEEAVFMAMILRWFYKVPYAYDLDSSLAQQVIESRPWLRIFRPVLDFFERAAIRGAVINLPVCPALAELCEASGSRKTVTLHDISQLNDPGGASENLLREELGLKGQIVLYVGNLEAYQGVDLLLEAFKLAVEKRGEGLHLVLIGGLPRDIESYQQESDLLGLREHVVFLGPRPFAQLNEYLASADILVSPRISGINTPMKIFPFLHSGKPVLATDLPTHKQSLTGAEACLAPAEPAQFGAALLELSEDAELRHRLGQAGRAFVERNHTFAAHRQRLDGAYDWIETQLDGSH